MISKRNRQRASWLWLGGALGGPLLVGGCVGASSEDCATTHSCPSPRGDAGAANEPSEASGGHRASGPGEAGASEAGANEGGAEPTAGGAPSAAGCRRHRECSNADETDGEESCVKGACLAGNPPPRVVAITPADGATDVPTDTSVVVTFSEPLDSKTVSPDSFKLFADDVEVVGTFELAAAGDRMTFTPDAALDLWTRYRVEIAGEVRDVAGAAMLEDFAAGFQVRDGAWSVTKLDQGPTLHVPTMLPQLPNGAVLASWLNDDASLCSASGRWLLRGQSQPSDVFKSAAMDSPCSVPVASVAPDGGAAVAWTAGGIGWAQRFQSGAWADSELEVVTAPQIVGFWAHDNGRSTAVRSKIPVAALFTLSTVDAESKVERAGTLNYGPFARVAGAFGSDGNGLSVWSGHQHEFKQVLASASYDAGTQTWSKTTVLPGSEPPVTTNDHRRGEPSVALAPNGEAMVLWVDNQPLSRVLMASHYTLDTGWEEPVPLSGELYVEPILDAPALVFDGQTFVGAWTAKASSGGFATYVSRYDMDQGTWTKPGKPHVSELGDSAVFMPRLGADSHRNLMLVWAIAGQTTKLVYERYRAETDEWSSAAAVPGVSFTEPTFETDGRLPFAFAPNGVGALMFRSSSSTSATLRLAQFY